MRLLKISPLLNSYVHYEDLRFVRWEPPGALWVNIYDCSRHWGRRCESWPLKYAFSIH